MNTLRPDLLALSSEALIALSNAGFVKKAQKDLSEGKSPELSSENGELIARYTDGHISTLPAGAGLRDARCTCPASGLCRHRVTMVLAYQQQANTDAPENESTETSHEAAAETWSPALFKTELDTLPTSILQRAYRLASANTLIRLTAWQSDSPTPTAHLPMCSVRFFSSHSLNHARCDCSDQQVCEHIALAVMAFAQAPSENWTQLNVTVTPPQQNATAKDLFTSEAAIALDQLIQTIALQLWQEGSSQPFHHLEALFAQALQLAEHLKWRWVFECLTALRQALLDQAARSSRAHPERTLALLCELQARWTSSRYACQPDSPSTLPPAAYLLGLGIQGEVALDHLRLISLGAQLSRDDQNESVQIIFCDPDTLALMVIEREWPLSEPSTPILQRRLLSQPLHKIMQSQIVTQAAKRHANGTLSIANTARHSNILPMTPDAWQQIAHPLRHPNAQSLQSWLQQADPTFAQLQQVVSQLYLLPVTEILTWGWDASSQTLRASLQCGEDEQLDQVELSLHYSACAPQSVDILAKILHDDALSMISGWAQCRGGRLYFEPIAVCDKERVIMLQAQQAAQSIEMPLWQEHTTIDPLHDLLQQSRALLAQWLLQGLVHLGSNIAQKVQYQAQQFRLHGLIECAERLQLALNSLQSSAPEQMPNYLTELYYLIFEYETEQSAIKDAITLPD